MRKVVVAAAACAIAFAITGAFAPNAYAGRDQTFSFVVEMIQPDNQIGDAGYYHVPGSPGEQIGLKARVQNVKDQPLDIGVVAMNAYGSQDGIIYQSPDQVPSQKYALADENYAMSKYINIPEPQLTLQPGEIREVAFSVVVPDIDSGTLLGGIRFVVFAGTNELGNSDDKVQILIDKYQAVDTAIQIDLPGGQTPSVGVENLRFNIEALSLDFDIVNQAALIQDHVSGQYDILNENGDILFSGEFSELKMAPSSKFRYCLPWQYEKLEEGDYTLSIRLYAGDEPFCYEQPFTIGNEQVEEAAQAQQAKIEARKTDIVPQIMVHKDYSGPIVLVGAAALMLFLLVFSLLQKKKIRM